MPHLLRRRNHEKGRWNGAPRNPLIRGKVACNRCRLSRKGDAMGVMRNSNRVVRVKKVKSWALRLNFLHDFRKPPPERKGEIHSKTPASFVCDFGVSSEMAWYIHKHHGSFFSCTFSGDDPNLTCLLLVWDISSNYKSVVTENDNRLDHSKGDVGVLCWW